MPKRVQIALAVLLVAIVGVMMWEVLREREPVYQGKSLSQWLEEYNQNFLFLNSPIRAQAKSAVGQIGTNALPILLEWTAKKDSILKKELMALAKRQSLVKIHFRSEDVNHRQ